MDEYVRAVLDMQRKDVVRALEREREAERHYKRLTWEAADEVRKLEARLAALDKELDRGAA